MAEAKGSDPFSSSVLIAQLDIKRSAKHGGVPLSPKLAQRRRRQLASKLLYFSFMWSNDRCGGRRTKQSGWLTRQTGRYHTTSNPNADMVRGLLKLDWERVREKETSPSSFLRRSPRP